jgi:hypothetical protein
LPAGNPKLRPPGAVLFLMKSAVGTAALALAIMDDRKGEL